MARRTGSEGIIVLASFAHPVNKEALHVFHGTIIASFVISRSTLVVGP
jgi:hypothetical protein